MKKPTGMAMSAPQGGWQVLFPNPEYPVVSNHYREFLQKCFTYLEANGLDTSAGWQDRVWTLLCDQHPEIPCEDTEAAPVKPLNADDVRRFLTTIYETWKSGAKAVSEELQNQRVSVCLACPHKGHTACFGGCSALSQTLSEFTIGRAIRSLPEIHKVSCLKCSCLLEVKTMFPVEVLRKVDSKMGSPPDYWEKCWMRSE